MFNPLACSFTYSITASKVRTTPSAERLWTLVPTMFTKCVLLSLTAAPFSDCSYSLSLIVKPLPHSPPAPTPKSARICINAL